MSEIDPEAKAANHRALKVVLIILAVLTALTLVTIVLSGWFLQKGFQALIDRTDNIEISDDGIRIETNDGLFSAGTDLPADFPSQVPLFKPADITGSTAQKHEGTTRHVVTFSSKASSRVINDFYATELSSGGWELITTSAYNGHTSYEAAHAGLLVNVNVIAGEDDEDTVFTVMTNE